MIEISELTVQVTLTIGEFRRVVEYLNIAEEVMINLECEPEPVVADISGLYFQLMKNIEEDGYLGEFEPEPGE